MTYYVAQVYDSCKKIRTHFHAVVRNKIVGKAVIYKALHKGDENLWVRIAEPLRNKDCSTANLFSLITVFVNENKCITTDWIQPKLLTKIYRIHDVWEFRRKIKLLKRWCYHPLREMTVPYGNCIRSFRDLIGNENPRRTSCLVSAGWNALHSA